MPKLVSSLVHAQIMLLNPLLKRMDLKASRMLQDAAGRDRRHGAGRRRLLRGRAV